MMMIKVLCLLIIASSITATLAAGNCNSALIRLNAPDLIESACTRCAERSMTNLTYCISSLQVLSVSHLVNLMGLGVVAMELVEENATATTETIQTMLDSGASQDPSVKDICEVCLEMYHGAIQTVEEAINAFQMDNFDVATQYMTAVQVVAETCEAEFQDSGKMSPLTVENQNLKELSSIVLCIIQLVSN